MTTNKANFEKTEILERVINEKGEVTLRVQQGDVNATSLPEQKENITSKTTLTGMVSKIASADDLLPLPETSAENMTVQGETASVVSVSAENQSVVPQEGRDSALSKKKSGSGTLMSIGEVPVQIRLEPEMIEVTHLYAAMERYTEGLLPQTTTDALQAMINGSASTGGGPQVLGISSAVRREGKTTVAIQLAMNIARNTYNKVALLDLSFESGSIAQELDLKGKGGVVPVLEGRDFRIPTLQVEGCENLWLLPLGELPRNPIKTAHSPQLNEVMGAIREMFDLIIVDLPPITSGYSLPLINHTDGLLLVIAAGMTPRHVVESAFEMVGKHRVIGTILNRTKPAMPSWLHKRLSSL